VITTPATLVAELGLPTALVAPAMRADGAFALRVPRSFMARMRPGDAADPLLRQVLPQAAELAAAPAGYGPDPLAERAATRTSALLHKYHGRALIITTGACAVHCRYCFRREFPYSEQRDAGTRFSAALAEIAADDTLEEIILSGGDPLSLSNARLEALTRALSAIAHVRRLRVHTRTPVVLPARVDAGLTDWLGSLTLPTTVVLHTNHARELNGEVAAACARLRASGVTLLNQSVLLRGINDDSALLAQLSQRLFECGVLPYYLHLLDRVRGAQHFAVSERRARRIAAELAARLPGYLVPRLARELPDAPGKVILAPGPQRARRSRSQCASAATIASTPSHSCSAVETSCNTPVA
jgi:EF-P beta-lysylation protein EpmB